MEGPGFTRSAWHVCCCGCAFVFWESMYPGEIIICVVFWLEPLAWLALHIYVAIYVFLPPLPRLNVWGEAKLLPCRYEYVP